MDGVNAGVTRVSGRILVEKSSCRFKVCYALLSLSFSRFTVESWNHARGGRESAMKRRRMARKWQRERAS